MGNETVRNRQEIPAEDPLAELARLMGQEDEFAELTRQSEGARRPSSSAPQSAVPRPQPYPQAPRPAAPRAPEPGRPAPGSFAALAAEVYSEGTQRPAAPAPRHSLEDVAREANRGFNRPEAPSPRPPEARAPEPRAPYMPPRPQPTEPQRRHPVAPPQPAAGGATARAPMAPAGEPVRPAPARSETPRPQPPRAEVPRPDAPRVDAPRPEASRPLQRAEAPQEPEVETRLPSWMARAAANNADQASAKAPAPGAPAQPVARAASPVQARQFELDEDAYDYGRSAADYDGEAAEPYDDGLGTDAPERRGRRRLLLIGGLMVAAVAVTAGAYVVLMRPHGASGPSGEPPVIHADQGPNKITPAQPAQEQQASDGQKLIYDRVGGSATTGNEKVVSSEEQPVDVSQAAQPQVPRVISTTPSSSPGGSSNSAEPKRVRTLTVRADGTVVADDSAPAPTPVSPASLPSSGQPAVSTPIPLNTGTGAPVSTNPTPLAATPSIVDNVPNPAPNRVAAAPAPAAAPAAPRPTATAAATPPAASAAPAPAGAYVVQIASVRSEAEAQATWRSMQGKFPGILSNQPFSVKRADLGDRGVYYRAQVGSFSGREDAVKLCEALRAQGGDCMVQRN